MRKKGIKELRLDPNFWIQGWNNNQHKKWRTKCFNVIDEYLKPSPKTILDIGCGSAFESTLFHKKYNCELWLLEGDYNSNTKEKTRSIDYGDVNDFRFYSKISDLKKIWDQNISNYVFVDANNINIPENKKFDYICSYSSCGIHYPLETYKELILKHSHKNTVCIFGLRNYIHPMYNKIQIIHKLIDFCENWGTSPRAGTNSVLTHIKL